MIGQQIQYQGVYGEAGNKLELQAKLPDAGTSHSTLVMNVDGSPTIKSVIRDPQGKEAVN